MRLQLEILEDRTAPASIALTGTIAEQAATVQQFVAQELSQIQATLGPLATVIALREAWQDIDPLIMAFSVNGLTAAGDPNAVADLSGFAHSLAQVSAALSLF